MTDALLEALSDALGLVQGAPATGWVSASDAQLARLIAVAAALRQTIERHAALGAGEVARRSTPERGLSGFVQQAGHRTVEGFLKAHTGVTGRDAATSVRVGSLDGAPGEALREGRVSVPAAEAIRAGLGAPTPELPREVLDQAAERLCHEALDPDRLHKRAREVRDELDEAGIGDRERARRAARSLRLVRQADGMVRIVWLLDPESAAIVTTVYDRATSPRGPPHRGHRVVADRRADRVCRCPARHDRHHHRSRPELRLHDERRKITRRAGRYWLEPPPGIGRTYYWRPNPAPPRAPPHRMTTAG